MDTTDNLIVWLHGYIQRLEAEGNWGMAISMRKVLKDLI